MKKIIICIMVVLMCFNCLPRITAHADVLTMSMISASAFAVASSSGLNFSFAPGFSASTADDWMQGNIRTWMDGATIAEKFGSEVMRLVAGKLVLPSMLLNGIRSFLNDFVSNNNIPTNDSTGVVISEGTFADTTVFQYVTNGVSSAGSELNETRKRLFWNMQNTPVTSLSGTGWEVLVFEGVSRRPEVYYDGTFQKTFDGSIDYGNTSQNPDTGEYEVNPWRWCFTVNSSDKVYITLCERRYNNDRYFTTSVVVSGSVVDGRVGAAIPGNYNPPQGLNDLQEWEGTVADGPDTNLDDLLDDIFEQGVEGTLSVTGEVIEGGAVDPPQPTTAPGSTTLDDIGETVGDISSTAEGIQEGVDSIAESAEGIAEGVTDIAEALEVPTAQEMALPDLRTLFPFCIPFDLYAMIQAFNATPQAPRAQIPFNIPALGLSYTFDIDLSEFDGVASTVRTLEFVAFAAGLAVLTSRLIKW